MVEIEKVYSGRTFNSGKIQETMVIDGQSEKVELRFDWETGSNKRGEWESGFWIWNYAQWDDP